MAKDMNPKLFDHTILAPSAITSQVATVCDEAIKYGFKAVCVNGSYTALASDRLKGSGVLTCTVIGFPLGQATSATKYYEAKEAIDNGACEIDMVINVGALKERREDFVSSEIALIKKACDGGTLKVIIETALLTDEEKVLACRLAMEAGADFVKTSTGYSYGGATAADVALMRKTVGETMGVKASGRIRTYQDVKEMLAAGADRIGTSCTVDIFEEYINGARG